VTAGQVPANAGGAARLGNRRPYRVHHRRPGHRVGSAAGPALLIFALVACVVSAFVIYNTFNILMTTTVKLALRVSVDRGDGIPDLLARGHRP
jgi:hypothetical protein